MSGLLVEITILHATSRQYAAQVLRDATTAYKVDVDAISLKLKQEFTEKEKGKLAPKPAAKTTHPTALNTLYPSVLNGFMGAYGWIHSLLMKGSALLTRRLSILPSTLESLYSRGRKVAVITHVAGMIDRIVVQVRVEKLGGGHSVVRLIDGLAASH